MHYWTQTLGVGPFFVLREMRPDGFRYRGTPSQSPLMSVALANSGDLQVEIIEQHDDSPSAYRDFLAAGREGLQHVSAWLTRDEYDAAAARMQNAGVDMVQEGRLAAVDVRFAYFDTDRSPDGLLYEIADVLEPNIYPMMEMIATAARDWDGQDPLRALN